MQRKNSKFSSLYKLFFIIVMCYISSLQGKVKSGLDVLEDQGFSILQGKNIGLVCNHTSCNKDGIHIVDLLLRTGNINIVAIFGPEHGYRGNYADGKAIVDTIDNISGARVYSLYGKINKPTPNMLKGIEIIVYDIQDIGARFYTYISTLTYVMESAAENNIPIIVLDRPNPIRGDRTEGPILDLKYRSFVGLHPIPIRYGLTVGELALLINGEGWLENGVKADLQVIRMEGWQRTMWYDETGLPWISPSPNMKTVETAILYPGWCLLEATNISEGRGTNQPFVLFGAPWIEATRYAKELNNLKLPGLKFEPIEFVPQTIPGVASKPKYEGEKCGGVKTIITDRNKLKPIESMVRILSKTRDLYPDKFQIREAGMNRLWGSEEWRSILESLGLKISDIEERWNPKLQDYLKVAPKYYLYK